MKALLFLFTLAFTITASSQEITNLTDVKPHEYYDNILVKKLDTDELSTSFVIWIKKAVKSHKHETHSEIIHVIEGNGDMTVGEKTFSIKSGDYFRIPQNTFHSLKVTSEVPMKVLSVQSPEFLGKDRVFEK